MPRNEDQRKQLKRYLERMNELRDAYVDIEALEKKLPFYDENHLYAKEWYKIIPPADSPLFPSFVYSSVELAVDVCQDTQVQLTIGRVGTACADKESMAIIILPHTLLREAVASRGFLLQDETAIMVAATNGMIVHEAAHLIKSPKDIEEAKNLMKDPSRYASDPAFGGFINTCEDIYIEWWLRETYPNLTPFVEAAHEFWFHEADLGERLHTFWLSRDIGIESYSGPSFFDLLIAMKNWRFADSPIWKGIVKEYNEELKCFRGLDKLGDRLAAMQTIWHKLRADSRLRWPESEHDRGEGSKFDSEGKCVGSKMAASMADEEREALRGEAASALIEEINKELNKRNIVIKIKKGQTDISKVPPTVVKVVEPSHDQVVPDKRFIPLAKRLRSVLTRNYAPGQPVKRGPKLVSTRLQRIVTDGKIFTYPETRKRTGRDFEIIILVDCSGSMSGGTPVRIVEAMSVGVGAYLSLRSARVRTVLLGHTSTGRSRMHDDEESPILYVFGEAKDMTERVKKRAARAFESGFKYNNYDGFAIEKAYTFFSDKPTKKWLIVVSDGQPAGVHYGGAEAIEHSRLAVGKARDKGIDVVSITIEDGAYKVNDRIYGREKNIHTRSSKVLLDLVEAMFTRRKGDGNGKA